MECIRTYGFTADPKKPIWKNIPSALKSILATTYLNSPSNLHCHNLCERLPPPAGFNILLGLGLNYCIEQRKPTPNIQKTMDKINNSVRLKAWLTENPLEKNQNYNPKLYLPSRWKPPEASIEIEKRLKEFKTALTEEKNKNAITTISKSNLTKLQQSCLEKIKNDRRYIVCLSDKNLGPVILERSTYFERCLSDHLLCNSTYRQLTENEATERVHNTRRTLLQLRLNHRNDLTEAENTYFRRNANLTHRLPQFYITIKIHKNPYKTRPIVSCIGSFLNAYSKWIDSHLQQLVIHNPTYIKDTQNILQDLQKLKNLPTNAKLFTCDAESMYTNINSIHGPSIIEKWIEEYPHNIPQNFPSTFLLKALQIVMNNNVFQFDDTYWLQICGTSMGTSCACSYATLYWAYFERKLILPKWSHSLIFLRRFIDDKIGIWTGSEEEFNDFLHDLNSYSQLKWTSSGLTSSVNFLDITITIEKNGKISTKTFQKPTNLHLYIPPSSAHPPGVLRSLIFGNLQRYWKQNTYVADFVDIAKQFANRLIARGYEKRNIEQIFTEAAKKLDNFAKTRRADDDTLYLHWTWHPRCISKPKLRLLYKNILKERSGFKNLIICYSRPKNLRDSLMKTKLNEPEGHRISDLLLQTKLN